MYRLADILLASTLPNEPVEVDEPLMFPVAVILLSKVEAPWKCVVPATSNKESGSVTPIPMRPASVNLNLSTSESFCIVK